MICPYCNEDKDVIRRGIRKNKFVKKQQYWCNKCKKYIIEHDGFEGMTYPKEIIAKTLHLYVEGLSLSKIRVRKYANLMSKFESNLKPRVKGRIHTDEVYVKVKGKGYYSINSIDSKTKYNLATTFTKHRSKQKCRAHFKKLKNKIGRQAKEIWENEKAKPAKERKLITFFLSRAE